jgi:hypothetical protein
MMFAGLKSRCTTPWRCPVERTGYLDCHPQCFSERQGAASDSIGECLTLDVFHHQELDAILIADIVERANVRVIQTRNGPSFQLESFAKFRLVRQCGRQNLDRSNAIQPRVACAIDLSHPTRADQCQDFVGA